MTSKLDLPGDSFFVHLTHASSHMRYVLVALACLLLAACGGGGGGANSGVNPSLGMSLSPQTVSVSAMTSQAAPTASVDLYVANWTPGTIDHVYIGLKYSDNGIVGASVPPNSTVPTTITIQFKSPASLALGTYTDTVTVYVCLDTSCSHYVSNSPQTIRIQYSVTAAASRITSLNSSSAYVGTQGFTLTVGGLNFTQQSVVLWNGKPLATAYASGSELNAQVLAADLAMTGDVAVSVSDPTYGVSNTQDFSVAPSPITIASLSPAAVDVGSPDFTLTLTGAKFTTASVVLWNGSPLPTNFAGDTQLTAQVPAANVAAHGTAAVSVADPTYGVSNAGTFTITAVPLALDLVSPEIVTVGGASFTLTVLGAGFTSTSVMQWNGATLPTKLVSSGELLAQIPASEISAAGSASVTVSDPNAAPGVVSPWTVTIAPPSMDATAFQMNPAHTAAVSFSSVSFPTSAAWSVNLGGTASYALIADGKIFVTVILSLTSATEGSEVLALDQATGKALWGPVLLSGVPTAAYDDGRVFVLSGGRISAATLQAFDADTGVLQWTKTFSEMAAWSGLPVAADGIAYVGLEGSMNAVAESDGTLLWSRPVGGTNMTAALTADGVYTSYGCATEDLRPATGETIWQFNAGCSGGGSGMPVVANQLVYSNSSDTGVGGPVFAAETGASVGSYAADSPPALTATMGYFLQGGTLQGVALSDNTLQWSFAGDKTLAGPPIAVNQYVLIGSSSGNLYALDGATGTVVWTVNLGAAIGGEINAQWFSGLAAGDGWLIVPNGTNVTAYQLSIDP